MKTKSIVPIVIAALAALYCGVVTGAPQSILLESGEFSLLGGTSITSTGTVGTVIRNGDIGLWTGTSITGFPPGVLENGVIRATSPETTGQAMTDLIRVQVGLAGMPVDTILSDQNLGGMTLLPGVYKFDVAAALTGALVLDGDGLNNAFWVFQIGTSLNTSVGSTVTVINTGSNGGSDYGVFWSAGAEIITGANNTLLGNYLSGTSITFGEQSSGGGRALAQAAITLDQNTVDVIGGLAGGDWTGGLMYNDLGDVVPVPEPSTYAALFGLSVLGFVVARRMRGRSK